MRKFGGETFEEKGEDEEDDYSEDFGSPALKRGSKLRPRLDEYKVLANSSLQNPFQLNPNTS